MTLNFKAGLGAILLVAAGLSYASVREQVPPVNSSFQVSVSTDDSLVRGLSYADFSALTPLDSIQATFLPELWRCWKSEEWSSLEGIINKHQLNGGYPPAAGFVSISVVSLKKGTKLDRYGSLYGSFVAPQGASFGSRALPAKSKNSMYYRFRVIKEIPNVSAGKAIPWFGEAGMGIQYKFQSSVKTLISDKYLVITDSIVPKPN